MNRLLRRKGSVAVYNPPPDTNYATTTAEPATGSPVLNKTKFKDKKNKEKEKKEQVFYNSRGGGGIRKKPSASVVASAASTGTLIEHPPLPAPPPSFPSIEPRHDPEPGPSRTRSEDSCPTPSFIVTKPDESSPPAPKSRSVRSVGASSRGGGATVKARDPKLKTPLRVLSPEEERELDEADLRSLVSGSGTGSSILTSSTRTRTARTAAGKVGGCSRGAGAGVRPPPRANRKRKPSSAPTSSVAEGSFESHLADLERLKSTASSAFTSTTGTSNSRTQSRNQSYGRGSESIELSSLRFSHSPAEEDRLAENPGDRLTADNLATIDHLRADSSLIDDPRINVSPFIRSETPLSPINTAGESSASPLHEPEWDLVNPPEPPAISPYTGPRFVIRDGIQVEMSANTSHLMKTTRRGRPFVKDTHDLFATLIVSLRLENHRSLFKVYQNSFSTDEACTNLASLKFSQSNRSPDPKDPSRIVTTTTTTTFSMTRDMAKGICQHFMDARLIENATDLDNLTFKDRGIYMLTPKGLHVLERFITKNGISAEHLLKVFATQSICLKLLHLERRTSDDEILIGKAVIEIIFKRFLGRQPNLPRNEDERSGGLLSVGSRDDRSRGVAGSGHHPDDPDRNLGIIVKKVSVVEREKSPTSSPGTSSSSPEAEKDKVTFSHDYIFLASAGMDWLCDFTTIVGRDEAAEMCAHFVRYGLIKMVPDTKSRPIDPSKVVVVRTASAPTGTQPSEAEFRFTEKTYYKVTPEGRRWAKWTEGQNRPSMPASSTSQPGKTSSPEPHRSSEDVQETARNPTRSLSSTTDDRMIRRTSLVDRLRLEYLDINSSGGNRVVVDDKHQYKDSHTSKLKQILEEPSLRSLFREFLRANFCEENLSFWLDVQDFKRRFHTTSSAVASPMVAKGPAQKTQGHSAMERHQQDLIAMAFVIYNTYLAPASACELNIDHNLREELVSYMSKIVAEVSTREGNEAVKHGTLDPALAAKSLQASQLQTMVRLYERIQSYIFRLMATDSVPKFCKTEKYVEIMQAVFDHEIIVTDPDGESKGRDQIDDLGMKSPARAYVTISQAANEKQAALLKAQQQNDNVH